MLILVPWPQSILDRYPTLKFPVRIKFAKIYRLSHHTSTRGSLWAATATTWCQTWCGVSRPSLKPATLRPTGMMPTCVLTFRRLTCIISTVYLADRFTCRISKYRALTSSCSEGKQSPEIQWASLDFINKCKWASMRSRSTHLSLVASVTQVIAPVMTARAPAALMTVRAMKRVKAARLEATQPHHPYQRAIKYNYNQNNNSCWVKCPAKKKGLKS